MASCFYFWLVKFHMIFFIDSTFNVITSLHHAMMQRILCKFISIFFATLNYPSLFINKSPNWTRNISWQISFLLYFHSCCRSKSSKIPSAKSNSNFVVNKTLLQNFCKIARDILGVCLFIPNSEEERDSPVLVLLIRFLLHGEPLRIVKKL